jgi:hypothetical protein
VVNIQLRSQPIEQGAVLRLDCSDNVEDLIAHTSVCPAFVASKDIVVRVGLEKLGQSGEVGSGAGLGSHDARFTTRCVRFSCALFPRTAVSN